jgi:hypothetical protein
LAGSLHQMLKSKIKINQFKKKKKINKSQSLLTFETSGSGHEPMNNPIRGIP